MHIYKFLFLLFSSIMSMAVVEAITQTTGEYKLWGKNCKAAGRKGVFMQQGGLEPLLLCQ